MTTCKHGHEIEGENVVMRRGKPTCRTCEHIHAARTRAKRRAASETAQVNETPE